MQLVSREALYNQIWTRPMMKVAADYGVSGTALKKICDRHNIPTPERGYWAKLAYGKRVVQTPLPKLKNEARDRVRIAAPAPKPLPDAVRAAEQKAREALAQTVAATPPPVRAEPAEHKALAATAKALARAKPDDEGFVKIKGRGVVPMKVAPASSDRIVSFLSDLLRLAEGQGQAWAASEEGLALMVDGETIGLSMEERSDPSPHTPTERELKRKAENERWGYGSSTPWPKYDHAPSGRLALMLGVYTDRSLARTWSDRKYKRLEAYAGEILTTCAAHAAMIKEERRRAEEARRLAEIAAARRRREAAYGLRQKRRMAFIDAVHGTLEERATVAGVLAHLEGRGGGAVKALTPMLDWLRLRLQQLDALLAPTFIEISARASEAEFDEAAAAAGPKGEDTYRYYSHDAALHYWSWDASEERWHGCSATEWAIEAGLMGDVGAPPDVGGAEAADASDEAD